MTVSKFPGNVYASIVPPRFTISVFAASHVCFLVPFPVNNLVFHRSQSDAFGTRHRERQEYCSPLYSLLLGVLGVLAVKKVQAHF
jgi:hypothetical protein